MKDKKYKSIKEVSDLLNLNTHVIRYWDSKFPGLSTRIASNSKRFFNNDNIKRIKDLKLTLYKNGKHNYSLDLANQLITQDKTKINIDFDINNRDNLSFFQQKYINHLKNIRENLIKLINI